MGGRRGRTTVMTRLRQIVLICAVAFLDHFGGFGVASPAFVGGAAADRAEFREGGAASACGLESQQSYLAQQNGDPAPPGAPPPTQGRWQAARLLSEADSQADFAARARAVGLFCPRLPDSLTAWVGVIDENLGGMTGGG